MLKSWLLQGPDLINNLTGILCRLREEATGITCDTEGRFHQVGIKKSDRRMLQWGSPSASDPRAKNTGQRATKGTVLTSQSLSPWCDYRRLGSTWLLGVGRI